MILDSPLSEVHKPASHQTHTVADPYDTGIRRRGMTIEALQQYMLSQGPSQATTLLEYDAIWATNKKVIDPIAPRFWAIAKDKLYVLSSRLRRT